MEIESTLAKYLEFKTFEFFRTSLINEITPHCRADSKTDLYKHLFLAPSQSSKKRNFQLHGVTSPFVCLWRTGSLEYSSEFYSRSVLPRGFEYTDTEGNLKSETGFLYDLSFDFELYSSSYYKTFRDRVNQDLLDMDRLRYFDFDFKELFTNCSKSISRGEIKLNGIKLNDSVDGDNRSFDLVASYKIKLSVPYVHSDGYLSGIEIYLNSNKIYSKDE